MVTASAFQFALALSVAPDSPLYTFGADRTLAEFDVAAGVGLTLRGAAHPEFTILGGAGYRAFSEDGQQVAEGWTPTLGLRTALWVGEAPKWSISPWLSVQADLREVQLSAGEQHRALTPVVLRLGMSLALGRRFTDSSAALSAP